jgi:hypothetical protein
MNCVTCRRETHEEFAIIEWDNDCWENSEVQQSTLCYICIARKKAQKVNDEYAAWDRKMDELELKLNQEYGEFDL